MAGKRAKRRQRRSNVVWMVGGILVVVLVVAVVAWANGTNASSAPLVASPPPPAALDKCGSATCGSATAPVTLDVYADFQCPYCKAFEPALEQLTPGYIDTGKVKLVYHHFPVIGAESVTAAQASLCAADQSRFWMFANDLFVHQGAENSGVFTPSNLQSMAVAAGLEGATFKSCLDSQKHASQVNQQLAEGTQRGVKATPSFFINGQIHEGGVAYPQLTALIDAALPK
jgi:protein-disulfide isomerase